MNESVLESFFPARAAAREIYGYTQMALSPLEKADGDGMAIVKDHSGLLMPLGERRIDTQWAAYQIGKLKDVCDRNHCPFLYVSFPSRKGYPGVEDGYGVEANTWNMRTDFLNGLQSMNIPVLDLRERLEQEGWKREDVFYKTDHHWTTDAGFFAAREIANVLKKDIGLGIQSEILSETNFSKEELKECWLGEMGRACSKSWTGTLDDFTVIRPLFETKLSYQEQTGDFSILMDETHYGGRLSDEELYNVSMHYSYLPECGSPEVIRNEGIENDTKILFIRDSFSQVVIPFLALTAKEVTVWDVRESKEGLLEEVESGRYDAVICAYTDYWQDSVYLWDGDE